MGGTLHIVTACIRSIVAYSHLQQLFEDIPEYSISLRKDLLSLSRVQQSLASNVRLQQALRDNLHYPPYLSSGSPRRWIRPRQVLITFAEAMENDPVLAGFVSMSVRSLPFADITGAMLVRDKILHKEFHATQGWDRPQMLDYSIWFSSDPKDAERPLSPFLRPRPELNKEIRSLFHDWRESLRGRLFYPQFSPKSASRETARQYWIKMGYPEFVMGRRDWADVSTQDLEILYMRTGIKTSGCCELRLVWRFNDLQPRAYFAQGATTYHSSKYIREPINSLADSFPPTAFYNRMVTARISAPTSHRLAIYDYASFTSNYSEQKYFIEDLSEFVKDIPIRILDTHLGVVPSTLGELLSEYNQVCNILPTFSMERLWDEPSEDPVYEHRIASFLGIYGNITSCTVAHGLHACQLCGSLDGCNCVGDDVILHQDREEYPDFMEAIDAIRSIGDVAQEKFHLWEEARHSEADTGWKFLKRPLDRYGERVVAGKLFDFPIVGAIFPEQDGIHDLDGESTPLDQMRLCANQTMRLVDRLHLYKDDMTEEQVLLAMTYLSSLYRKLGMPQEGMLPGQPLHNHRVDFIIPPIDVETVERGWSVVLKERYLGSFASLPVAKQYDSWEDAPGEIYAGQELECLISKPMSLLCSLGLADKEMLTEEWVVSDDYFRKLQGLLDGSLRTMYKVVIRERPKWWSDVIV